MVNLYPDQRQMIDSVVASMQRGHKSVLLQAPTGSGKSVMATEILRRAIAKGSDFWFMVPRRELIRQMSKTMDKFGIEHGYHAAGYPLSVMKPGYICSTDTIQSRLNGLKPPKIAVIDETHYGGEGLDRIIKWLKDNNTYVIGLSATPWRLSGKGLGCWYSDMVTGPSIRELIDSKRLSDYRAFAPDRVDLSGIRKSAGDYAKGQLSERMEGDRVLIGNAVKHYITHAMGRLNIAYCVSIAHSQMVAQSFRDAGIPAAHIDGTTKDDERKRIITAFAKRELLVLTNCELLTFGFDLASQVDMDVTVECMSDLRPTKSLALQMQKWGRVLRYKDQPAIIFDHANNFEEHDLPCAEREWSLSDREKGAGNGGGEKLLPVKRCDQCYYYHSPSPACPNCGHVYPVQSREIEEVDGALSEIEVANLKKIKRIEVGKAKTIDDLKRIASQRGYAQGWVFKMANVKGIRA